MFSDFLHESKVRHFETNKLLSLWIYNSKFKSIYEKHSLDLGILWCDSWELVLLPLSRRILFWLPGGGEVTCRLSCCSLLFSSSVSCSNPPGLGGLIIFWSSSGFQVKRLQMEGHFRIYLFTMNYSWNVLEEIFIIKFLRDKGRNGSSMLLADPTKFKQQNMVHWTDFEGSYRAAS